MAEKIATRAAYGKALVELADQEPNLVVLDADLSGSTMTKEFAAAHPDRFFDMGIAEANMVGVAAGLATCGKKPFVNSFAMFAAGRAWEQVRNSVAYPGLNVKVVGSHGGLSVGEDGATHQCIEDLAIMRAIPNMTVLCPCDGYEMREARQLLERLNPTDDKARAMQMAEARNVFRDIYRLSFLIPQLNQGFTSDSEEEYRMNVAKLNIWARKYSKARKDVTSMRLWELQATKKQLEAWIRREERKFKKD